MPFWDHLEELRRRLILSGVVLIALAVVAFYFGDVLMAVLRRPLERARPDLELHLFGVPEAFVVRMKVAIAAGLAVGVPFFVFQLWRFVAPGLRRREVRAVAPLLFFSVVMLAVGVSFAYFVVLPMGITFLLSFARDGLTPLLMLNEYFSFVATFVVAFGIVFQLPVVLVMLGRLGLVSSRTLARGRRVAAVGILVLSAVITPPDLVSQVAIGAPLYLLYEISVLLVWRSQRSRQYSIE
jgi:sec-independent protein translocase protein TatC